MDGAWKAVCRAEDQDVWLGVDDTGKAFFRRDGKWEFYDFNALHRGYYDPCRFTTAARAGGLFYLAGLDEAGAPHVFSSLLGGVWEERNLTARRPMEGEVRASGAVKRILYDDDSTQVFLICQNGQLVTLPDCPKCVRILDLPGGPAEDGWLEDGCVAVRMTSGAVERVPLSKAVQYRVSESFAAQQMQNGACLVDLRNPGEFAAGHMAGSVNVPMEDMDLWLRGRDPGQTVIFVCRTGIQADEAVRYARRAGFSHSYSLGGMNRITRVK